MILTLHDIGRIEIKDRATGNNLTTFHFANQIIEFLEKHNIPLSSVDIEWHEESFDGDLYEGDEE